MSSQADGLDAILANRSEIDSALGKHKSPVTVMFTDLVGSTAYFDRHGDTVGLSWIEEHNSIVIPIVQANYGIVVKTIGDSVMASFTDPAHAIAAAIGIQRQLLKTNASRDAGSQMRVRVALHHGLAYVRGFDVFGDVVNVAARLAKACAGYQILISESVYQTVHHSGQFPCRPVGTLQLTGKAQRENGYEVLWTDAAQYDKLRAENPAKPSSVTRAANPAPATPGGGGRYQIISEIGHGGMGVVYRAYDGTIGRVVAMKTITLDVDPELRDSNMERLKAEAQMAGQLDHPNIVTVHDVGEEAGLFFFTMQYLEGKTLEHLRNEKVVLPMSQRFKIADQICGAVAYAHQAGIIHRDLKPSNVMLCDNGVVKVLDFGIAKVGDSGMTKAGLVLGTPSFMSPEQALGRHIDHRADIFSLGSLIYELFTNERAFGGDSTTSILYKLMQEDPIAPRLLDPMIPSGFDEIIDRALAKDPSQRYQTVEELRLALRDCEMGTPAFAPRSKAAPLAKKSAAARQPARAGTTRAAVQQSIQRPKTSTLVISLVIVLAAAITGTVLLTRGKTPTKPTARAVSKASAPVAMEVPDTEGLGADDVLDKAKELWQAGQTEATLGMLHAYLQAHPEEAAVRIRYATLLAIQQKFEDAEQNYQMILKFDPKNMAARIGMAKVKSWNNDLPGALKLYNQILAESPANYDAKVGKAFTLLWMKHNAEAKKLFEAAHTEAPNDAEVTAALNKLSGQ